MPDVNQSIVLQSRTKQGQSEAVCWKRYLCLDRSMEIMEWHFWQQGKQNGLEVTSCRKKFQGIPLYRHALEKLEAFSGLSRVVVTAREALAEEAQRLGIHIVENRQPEQGISHSVSLALQELLSQNPDLEGVLFLVCDQPGIQAATIQKILNEGCLHKNSIVCAGYDGMRGNPVFVGKHVFQELCI